MSLQELVAEAGHALGQARQLFGNSPNGGPWSSTPTLSQGRAGVAQAVNAAGGHWKGNGASTYRQTGSGHVKAFDRFITADNKGAPALGGAVRVASSGGQAVEGIIGDTRAGVAAIAPSTGTPAGQAELVTHLRSQLARAKALLQIANQRNVELAGSIRAASAGYAAPPFGISPQMGGPATMPASGGVGGSSLLPNLSGLVRLASSHRRGQQLGQDPLVPHHDIRGAGPAAQMAVKAALTRLGRPYVWGAKGPNAFDCSGLVHWAYAQAGVTLGNDTYSMFRQGAVVAPGEVQAGDAIFPRSSFDSRGPGHVMLAISPTQCIEAQQSGVPVKISPMPSSFVARRVAL